MDTATYRHFSDWIDDQFPESLYADRDRVHNAMYRQYGQDPERYDREGWWKCYEDAGSPVGR